MSVFTKGNAYCSYDVFLVSLIFNEKCRIPILAHLGHLRKLTYIVSDTIQKEVKTKNY